LAAAWCRSTNRSHPRLTSVLKHDLTGSCGPETPSRRTAHVTRCSIECCSGRALYLTRRGHGVWSSLGRATGVHFVRFRSYCICGTQGPAAWCRCTNGVDHYRILGRIVGWSNPARRRDGTPLFRTWRRPPCSVRPRTLTSRALPVRDALPSPCLPSLRASGQPLPATLNVVQRPKFRNLVPGRWLTHVMLSRLPLRYQNDRRYHDIDHNMFEHRLVIRERNIPRRRAGPACHARCPHCCPASRLSRGNHCAIRGEAPASVDF
jgi:hypothetical protein